jgi:hypothetical protein
MHRSGLRARQRREPGEVRPLHVIEKAADALVDVARIQERLELGIEQPSELEERREPTVDLGERRVRLAGSTPRKLDRHASCAHRRPTLQQRLRRNGAVERDFVDLLTLVFATAIASFRRREE